MDVSYSSNKGVLWRPPKAHVTSNAEYPSYIKVFKQVCNLIDNEMTILNTSLVKKYFSKLMARLKHKYSDFEYLPTMILSTGFNHSDRFMYLNVLQNDIITEISPFVISLNRTEYKNVKLCIESIVLKFLNVCCDTNELKKYQLNFNNLKKWYRKKRRFFSKTYSNTDIPLIIFFDDIGSINRLVLKDIISILWSQMTELPIIIILVSFTSFQICLNEFFERESVLKMKINLFECPSAEIHLKEIIENIILSETCPVLLQKQSFEVLLNSFNQFDFSIQRFMKHFKFALFNHFAKGKIYELCATHEFKDFSDENFEDIRKCYSIRQFVENQSAMMQIHFFENPLCVLTATKHLLKNFASSVSYFLLTIRCLHILISDLPTDLIDDIQFVTLYLKSIQDPFLLSKEYENIKKFLLSSSLNSLLERIEEIIMFLGSKLTVIENEAYLKQFLIKLNIILKKFHVADKNFKDDLDIKKTFIIETFDKCFNKYLKPMTCYSLHELFFFTDDKILSEQKRFSPQYSIHEDLINPHCYLKCVCCKLQKKSLVVYTLPNISLVYKLQLEYKSTINVDSWFQTFEYMIQKREFKKFKNDDIAFELRNEFSNMIDYLLFLGLIKLQKKGKIAVRLTLDA